MILRCQKCQSRLDKENEFCQSCGAYNPYYGLTTEEEDKLMLIESQSTVDLSKPQGDVEQLHRLSQAAHRDSKPPKNPYIKRWIILAVIMVVVAIIMMTSGDPSTRQTGESLMKSIFTSGLRVGAIVLIPVIVGAITGAVSRRKSRNEAVYKCPNCGNTIPQGSTFCNHCGSAITASTDSSQEIVSGRCLNCGTSLTSEQKSCPKCHVSNPLYIKKNGSHVVRNTAIAVAATAVVASVGFIIYSNATAPQDNNLVESENEKEDQNIEMGFGSMNDGTSKEHDQIMDFEFSTMNDGTSYAVVGYNGYDTEINIPDTYKGIPVTMIGGYAFQDNTMIKSVSFSANLIGVGDYAFDGCTSLTTVTFRDSDSGSDHCQIFENAFSDCASLKTVNMPSHQVTMATYAFANCEQLSNINLSNIYRIGDGAFMFCNSLSKVNINAQYIDDCAFSFCNGLKSVKVSNAEIAYAAFEYCDLLEKFTGVNVVSIGSRAFGDCTNLTDVDLSESPNAEIASDAFDGSRYSYGVSGAHPYAATNFLGMTVDEAVSILGYNYEDHYMQGAMGHYYQDYGLAIPYGEASINAPYITSIEAFGSQYVSNGYGYMDKIHAGMSFREIFDVIGEQELSIDNMFGMVSFSVSYDNVRFYFYIMKSFDEGDDILGAVPSCMVSLV